MKQDSFKYFELRFLFTISFHYWRTCNHGIWIQELVMGCNHWGIKDKLKNLT